MNENSTILKSSVIDAIDSVNDVVMESSIEVFGSLGTAYDKAYMILENYNGDDTDAFAIFQEAETDGATNANTSGDNNGGGILSKIIHFIPNILKKIWEFIKQAWNGNIVPMFKSESQNVENVSEKTESLFNQVIGKTEDWVKEHQKELGIASGATLSLVSGFVAFLNRDKLSKLAADWLNNIKTFFKKIPQDINETKVIFELTVGNKFKSNVSFKGLVEALKALPGFFKKVKEAKLRPRLDTSQVPLIEIKEDLEQCVVTAEQISQAEIILNETTEYDIASMLTYINDFNQSFTNIQTDISSVVDSVTLTNEQIAKIDEMLKNNKDSNNGFKKVLARLSGVLSNIGKMITTSAKAVKMVFDKIIGIFRKKSEIDKQLKKEYGVSNPKKEDQPSTDSNDLVENQKNDSIDTDTTTGDDTNTDSTDNGSTDNTTNDTSNDTSNDTTDPDFEAKKAEVLEKYNEWREKNPDAKQDVCNGVRNKIAKSLGLSKKQARRIVVESTTMYGTNEFGDIPFQESVLDECYGDTVTASSGWYNR